MEVTYNNNKLEKVCTNASYAERVYGALMAEKIQMRIDQICSASCVEEMVDCRIGRCHELNGNRKGQFAVDLVQPYRLVFAVCRNEIQIANITEIVDYH